MRHFTRFLTAALLLAAATSYSQTINTLSFHKVIVSPYIEVIFIQGDQEKVVINRSDVDPGKLHVETNNGTLRIYLEGAKVIPRESRDNRRKSHHPLYPDHAVTATIYYKKIDALSLRGDEHFAFTSPMSAERFRSEEHTSELQSRLHLVCRLLLEKKHPKHD